MIRRLNKRQKHSITASILVICLAVCLMLFAFTACDDDSGEKPIESLVVSTLPKVEYYRGDLFELGNAALTVYYEGGKVESVPITANMISDFDADTIGSQTLTVLYKDKATYITVNVSYAPVYAIAVSKMPDKTTYVVDEVLSIDGMELSVTYSNGFSETIAATADMVVSFSTDNVGETDMSILYGGKLCTVPYTVVKKSPIKTKALIDDVKKTYIVGDTLSLDGGKFSVTYNNAQEEVFDWKTLYENGELTYAIDSEEANVFTSSSLQRTVTVFYKGEKYQYLVKISELKPSGISVLSKPQNQIMDGTLDWSGAQLYVAYNTNYSGYTPRVENKTEEAKNYYDAGRWQEFYQRYFVKNGEEFVVATQTYSATAEYYVSLETSDFDWEQRYNFLFEKKGSVYKRADSVFNASTVYYITENAKILDFSDEENVSFEWNDFTLSEVGDYTIKVLVGNTYTDCTVRVIAPTPVALVVTPSSSLRYDSVQKEYYVYQDETIDYSTWSYQIQLNNGKYSVISSTGTYVGKVTEDMYIGATALKNHDIGKYAYKFSVSTSSGGELSCVVSVTVRAKKIVSADFVAPERTVYSVGDELDLTGGKILVYYNSGETGEWTNLTSDMIWKDGKNVALSTFTAISSQSVPVVVHYADDRYDTFIEVDYSVLVVQKAVKIELSADSSAQTDYILGDTFSTEDLEVRITYDNGSPEICEEFTGEEWTFVGTEFNAIGQKTVYLYYGDISDGIFLSFVCTVTNNVSELKVNKPFVKGTTEGTDFDFSDIELTVVRQNGDEEKLPVTSKMIVSYDKANVYQAQKSYTAFEKASSLTQWEEFGNYFYIYENSSYQKAQTATADTYYVDNNFVVMSVLYVDENTKEQHTATLYGEVICRQITAVSVNAVPCVEYTVTGADKWNLDDLQLLISFNNGTSALIAKEDISYDEATHKYSFVRNNVSYSFEVGYEEESAFTVYTLTDMQQALTSGSAPYKTQDIAFRVFDSEYSDYVSSEKITFYCFKQLVEAVSVVFGVQNGNSVTAYSDQVLYINEGIDLYEGSPVTFKNDNLKVGTERRYVTDGETKYPYLEHSFIVVKYVDVDEKEVIRFDDERLSSGFSVSGYNKNTTGAQTVSVTYLLKSCTFTAKTRPNEVKEILLVDENKAEISSLTVVEGTNIDSSSVYVLVTSMDADGVELSEKSLVSFLDADCTYDKTETVSFGSLRDEDGIYYKEFDCKVSFALHDETPAEDIFTVRVQKKSVSSLLMQIIPQQVYAEQPEDAVATKLQLTNASGVMGTVLVRYNNGTSEVLTLDDRRITVNDKQFKTKLTPELTGGAEQSQTIYIRFTDENGVEKQTSYNIVVKDRKYLSVVWDKSNNISFDKTFYCQYGTGIDAGPKYTVWYYEDFYASGAVECDCYTVEYENTLGVKKTEWPTEVGRYKIIISYAGDAANNAFTDEDVYLEIQQREIGIVLQTKTVTYGDLLTATTEEDITSLNVLDIKWEMQGFVGGLLAGSGTAYAFDDTADKVLTIAFEIYDENNNKVEFYSDENNLVISCNAGTYTVKPIITLVKNENNKTNYTVPSNGLTNGTFVVEKMPIKVVAKEEKKLYGQGDPLLEYTIYDYDKNGNLIGLIGGCYYQKVTGMVGEITGNYYTYNTNTYRFEKATGIFDAQTDYYTFVSSVDLHGYADTMPTEYRLQREAEDNDNVNEKHVIEKGSSVLTNYEIKAYEENQLIVYASPIVVGGDDISRPFGTLAMDFTFGLRSAYSLQNSEKFDDVFGSYFQTDAKLYYDMTKKEVYETLPDGTGDLDNWAVLVKNVQIDGFNSIVYKSANYVVIPVATDCATYTCTIDPSIFSGVYNYTVSSESFTLTIEPITATLNVGSVLVYEKSTIVDKLNKTLQTMVPFSGNTDLSLHTISGTSIHDDSFVFGVDERESIDSDYEEWLKNLILGVSYDTGSDETYRLSVQYLEGYSFTKATGTDTGIYRVMVEADVSKNFSSFGLISYNTKTSQNFVSFYYNQYKDSYSGLEEINDEDFAEGAYVIVMPSYIDLSYYYTETAPYHEEYSKTDKNDWFLDADYTLDAENFTNVLSRTAGKSRIESDSITYSIATDNQYLDAGKYTATVTYSFFADVDKESKFSTDYVYRGSSNSVSDKQWEAIVRYMFFGTIPEEGEDEVIFSKDFDYTIDQYQIGITFINENEDFGFADKVLKARLNRSMVSTDTLSCLFNVSVLYNMKEDVVSQTSSKVRYFNYYAPIGKLSQEVFNAGVYYDENGEEVTVWDENMTYYQVYTNTDLSYSAFNIYNAGSYTFTLPKKNIGNSNYVLVDEVQKTFTVNPISIPVLLFEDVEPSVTTQEEEFNFRLTYNNKKQNPIYSDWVPATYYEYTKAEVTASLQQITSAVSGNSTKVGTVNGNDLYLKFFTSGTVQFVNNTFTEGNKVWKPSTAGETATANQYGFYYKDGDDEIPVYYDVSTGSFYTVSQETYSTYRTASCFIVPYYYNLEGNRIELDALESAPNSLEIFADDGNGNYPIQVKRNKNNKEEILGYGISFKTNSVGYNDYSVVLVYRENCQFYQCDEAHDYSCIIEPYQVTLTNFTKKNANTKEYDGADAEVPETSRGNMALSEQVYTDQFDINDVVFSFTRNDEEGSTTIGSYRLIDAGDLRSCGTFTVNAYYSDNYDIYFGVKNKTTGDIDLEKTATYTITPTEVTIPFIESKTKTITLTRNYNGIALADEIGNMTDFPIETVTKLFVDELSDIYYRYVPKKYSATTEFTDADVTDSSNVGYYWFTFEGMFVDQKGEYHSFADCGYANRLSWNYTYKSGTQTACSGYDGIYGIKSLLIYVGVDTQVPTNKDESKFTYERIYDGKKHETTALSVEIKDKLQYYVYQNNEFVALKNVYSCDPNATVTIDSGYESKTLLNYGDSTRFIIEASDNYNVFNKTLNVTVSKLEIEISVSLINATDDNSSDITFGKVLRENAIIYSFGISDEQLARFNAAQGTSLSVEEVLQQVLTLNGTSTLELTQEDGNVVYKYSANKANTDCDTTAYYKNEDDAFVPVSDRSVAGTTYLQNGMTYYSKKAIKYNPDDDKVYYNYVGEYIPASGTAVDNVKYYQFTDPIKTGKGEVLKTGNNYYKVDNNFRSYQYRKADGETEFYTISVADVGVGDSVEGYYVFTEYYMVTEDEYFTSYSDYYYFTTAEVTVGKSVQANTYYVNADFDCIVLTSDKVFEPNVTYFVRNDAVYSVGERVSYQYYKETSTDVWTEVIGEKNKGETYYFFTESIYSAENSAVTYYYYYDTSSASYKQASDIEKAQAYALRSILVAERNYVTYYSTYACFEEQTVTEFDDSTSYYRMVEYQKNSENNTVYYKHDLLLKNFDYKVGDAIPAEGVYQFSLSDVGFFKATGTYVEGINYYSLTVVEDLTVGSDVSEYFVAKTNGNDVASYNDTHSYAISAFTVGDSSLVERGAIYEQCTTEGVSYYQATADIRYQKNKTYYRFECQDGAEYLYVDNVLYICKKLAYGQGKDYLRGDDITGDVFVLNDETYQKATGKYLYDEEYYEFISLDGYVDGTTVSQFFVKDGETFVKATKEGILPEQNIFVGGKIVFEKTKDVLYTFYDIGDVIPQNTYNQKNGQYELTEDSIFQSNTVYYMFIEETELVAGTYFVASEGLMKTEENIASMRIAVAGRDYTVGAKMQDGFYNKDSESGVMLKSSDKTFKKDKEYYVMNAYYGLDEVSPVYVNNGNDIFILTDETTYQNIDNYYYVFSLFTDYKKGDSIPENANYYGYKEDSNQYVLTSDSTFGDGYYYVKTAISVENDDNKVIKDDYYEKDSKGRFVLTQDTTFVSGKKYYTFNKQNVSYSDVLQFFEYDSVKDSYVITCDEKYDSSKTYYYFTQTTAALQSILYEKVTGIFYNISTLKITADVYYLDGSTYVYAYGEQYDENKTYYSKRIQSLMLYDGASSYIKTLSDGTLYAGQYYIGGTFDNGSGNYSVKVIPTPVTVSKQQITVEGMERTYLGGKETWEFVLSDDTEKSAEVTEIMKNFITNASDEDIVDNTSVYDNAGTGYSMYVAQSLFRNYNDKANNYTILCLENTDVNSYVLPLTINPRPVTVSINVKDAVQYGELVKLSVTDTLPSSDLFSTFRTELTTKILDMDSLKSYIATTDVSSSAYSRSLAYHLQTAAYDILQENYSSLDVTFGEMTFSVTKKIVSVMINPVLSYIKNSSINGFSILYSQMDEMSYYDYTADTHKNTDYSISFKDFSLDGILYSASTMEEQLAKMLEGVSIRYYVYKTQADKENNNPLYVGDSVQELYEEASLKFVKTENTIDYFFADLEEANKSCETYKVVLTYKNTEYESAQAFLLAYHTSFGTTIRNTNNEDSVYCGENRIKASSSLLASSKNFDFSYSNSIIYIYPEIAAIGDYGDYTVDGKYIVGDTETVINIGDNSAFTMDQSTKEISGISFMIPLIMNGSTTPKQYYDTALFVTTPSNQYSYPEDYSTIKYTRSIGIEYISGGREEGGKTVFAAGDVIYVKVVVKEQFFDNTEFSRTLESTPFRIRLVEGQVVDSNGGSKSTTVLANKNDITLVDDDNSIKQYNVSSSVLSGTYSLQKDEAAYQGLYDVLTLRLSLTPKKKASTYSFTANVYENDEGTLSVTFVGGDTSEGYIRFIPQKDMLFLSAHSTKKNDGTVYSTLTEVEESDKTTYKGFSVSYVENQLGGKLYVKATDSDATVYVRATGVLLSSENYYLAATSQESDVSTCYVPYSEDYIDLNDIVSIFDGRSHTISIILDKVGNLTSLSQKDIQATCKQENYFVSQKKGFYYFFTESLAEGSENTIDCCSFNEVTLVAGTPLYNELGEALYYVEKEGDMYLPTYYAAKENTSYYYKVAVTFTLQGKVTPEAGTSLLDSDGLPLYFICEEKDLGELGTVYRFSKPDTDTADGTTEYYTFVKSSQESCSSNDYYMSSSVISDSFESTECNATGNIVSGLHKYYIYVEVDAALAEKVGGTDNSVGLFLSYIGGIYRNTCVNGEQFIEDCEFFAKDGNSVAGKASISFENTSVVVTGVSIKSRKLSTIQKEEKYYVRNTVSFPSIMDEITDTCITSYKTQNETASQIIDALSDTILTYHVLNGSTDTEKAMKDETYVGENDHNLVESILVQPNSSFTYRNLSDGANLKEKQLTYGLYKLTVYYTYYFEENSSVSTDWLEYTFMILPTQSTTSLQKYESDEDAVTPSANDPVSLSAEVSWVEFNSGTGVLSGCKIADKTYYYEESNGVYKLVPCDTSEYYEGNQYYISLEFDESVSSELEGQFVGNNIFEYQNGSYVQTEDTVYSADKVYYSIMTVLDTNGLEGVTITSSMNIFTFDYEKKSFDKVTGILDSGKDYYIIDTGEKLAEGTETTDYYIYDTENDIFESPRAFYIAGKSYYNLTDFGGYENIESLYYIYDAENEKFVARSDDDYDYLLELWEKENANIGVVIPDGIMRIQDSIVGTSDYVINTTNYALSTLGTGEDKKRISVYYNHYSGGVLEPVNNFVLYSNDGYYFSNDDLNSTTESSSIYTVTQYTNMSESSVPNNIVYLQSGKYYPTSDISDNGKTYFQVEEITEYYVLDANGNAVVPGEGVYLYQADNTYYSSDYLYTDYVTNTIVGDNIFRYSNGEYVLATGSTFTEGELYFKIDINVTVEESQINTRIKEDNIYIYDSDANEFVLPSVRAYTFETYYYIDAQRNLNNKDIEVQCTDDIIGNKYLYYYNPNSGNFEKALNYFDTAYKYYLLNPVLTITTTEGKTSASNVFRKSDTGSLVQDGVYQAGTTYYLVNYAMNTNEYIGDDLSDVVTPYLYSDVEGFYQDYEYSTFRSGVHYYKLRFAENKTDLASKISQAKQTYYQTVASNQTGNAFVYNDSEDSYSFANYETCQNIVSGTTNKKIFTAMTVLDVSRVVGKTITDEMNIYTYNTVSNIFTKVTSGTFDNLTKYYVIDQAETIVDFQTDISGEEDLYQYDAETSSFIKPKAYYEEGLDYYDFSNFSTGNNNGYQYVVESNKFIPGDSSANTIVLSKNPLTKGSDYEEGQSIPKNVYVYNEDNDTFTNPSGVYKAGVNYYRISVKMVEGDYVIGQEVKDGVQVYDKTSFKTVVYAKVNNIYVRISKTRNIQGITSQEYTYVYDETNDCFTKVSDNTYDENKKYYAINIMPTVSYVAENTASSDVYRMDQDGNYVHDNTYDSQYSYINLNHAMEIESGATLPENTYFYENGTFTNVSGQKAAGKNYYSLCFGTDDYVDEKYNELFLTGTMYSFEGVNNEYQYIRQMRYDASKVYYSIDYQEEKYSAVSGKMYPKEIESDIFVYDSESNTYVKPDETTYLDNKTYFRKTFVEFSYFSNEMENSIQSSTFIFDADFSDTSSSSLWLYLGISDPKIKELDSSVQGVQKGGGLGIGITASLGKGDNAGTINMSTKVYATLYKEPATSSDSTSYYNSWTCTYDDNDEVREISYIDWNRGTNILKVDYSVNDAVYGEDGVTVLKKAESVITIRLYQYYEKNGSFVTDLVWQEIIRNGAMILDGGVSSITMEDIHDVYDAFAYQGISTEGVDLKLYSLENNIEEPINLDFTKYDFDKSIAYILAGNSSTAHGDEGDSDGVFVSAADTIGDSSMESSSSGTDKPMQGQSGSYYVLADEYSTPYAYTGNAHYLRMKSEEKVVGNTYIDGKMRNVYISSDGDSVNQNNGIVYQSAITDNNYNTYLYYYDNDNNRVRVYNLSSFDMTYTESATGSFYYDSTESTLNNIKIEKNVDKEFSSVIGQIAINGENKYVYLYVKTVGNEQLSWLNSSEVTQENEGNYYLYYYASNDDVSETVLHKDSLYLKNFDYYNNVCEYDIKVGSYLNQDVYLHIYDVKLLVKNGIKLAKSNIDSDYNAYLYYYKKESDEVYRRQNIYYDTVMQKYITYEQKTLSDDFVCDTSCDFMWYLASTTPYISNSGNYVTTRQRGCLIVYTEGRLAFEVYKYNKEYIRQYLDLPSGFDLYDGEEHTISVVFAFDEEQVVLDGFLRDDTTNGSFRYYKVYIFVDGVKTECYCPVLNDLEGISDVTYTSGSDGESNADNNFFTGLYYTGIRTAQQIQVYDLYVYEDDMAYEEGTDK